LLDRRVSFGVKHRSKVLPLIFIICLTFLLGNCGKGSKEPPQLPPEITLPISKTITATQGGRVEIPSPHVLAGTSIEIPANALATDTEIILNTSTIVNRSGFVGTVIKLTPDNVIFNSPARVTLIYEDSDLPNGIDESQLLIVRIKSNDQLMPLANIVVDTENNQVSGEILSLSDFVIVLPNTPGLPSPPVANAGIDQTVALAQLVVLDATKSTDTNGSLLTYRWQLTAPIGSQAILSDENALQPSFSIDLEGDYIARLIVNNGWSDSSSDEVVLSTNNSMPVAVAGHDQNLSTARQVMLDGSGSYDMDGDSLKFSWSLSIPRGSSAVLSNVASINPSFEADLVADYIAELIVNDGKQDSLSGTVIISTTNSHPVANAGVDKKVQLGEQVILDGSQSSDVNEDPLSHHWSLISIPDGSQASLAGVDDTRASFSIDLPGIYVAQLIVNDGTVASPPDNVVITSGSINSRPQAEAGSDIATSEGETFTLDGSASIDPDNDLLNYRWSLIYQPEDSNAILLNDTTVTPSADVDKLGTYIAQLIVSDETLSSEPDTVVITTEGARPVANAGEDLTVLIGDSVFLDGSNSFDADGDPLAFSWSLQLPEGSTSQLSDTTIENPNFVMDKAGSAIAQLIVNDGVMDSLPDKVVITTQNSAPTADAGVDRMVSVGSIVNLNATGSSDAEGDRLSYFWQLKNVPENSNVEISDVNAEITTFEADVVGDYTIELIANDGEFDSETDQVIITASSQAIPTINSISPEMVAIGDLVVLSGENLKPSTNDLPQVTLAKQDGGRLNALVTSHSQSELSFTIPPGAASGAISLDVGLFSIISDQILEITSSSNFSLSVAPEKLTVIQGQSAAYVVILSSENGFNQLVNLALSGLPQGMSASFKPQKISVGQSAILTLHAPEDQNTGQTDFTVTAIAEVEGIALQQSEQVMLDVQAITTSFKGRVVLDDTHETPLQGVIVSFEGINENGEPTGCTESTTADAAGNFTFYNLPDHCLGHQVVHYEAGDKVTNLPGLYAEVDQRYFIEKDQSAVPVVPVHLPRLDTAESVSIIQNHSEDQHFIFESIPNLEITVYAGTTFTLRDGSQPDPFVMYAVDLESDRIPSQTPQTGSQVIPRLLAFQPDGTHASQPMAVSYPNVLNVAPGTQVPLLALDRLQGRLAPYGTGTVSANGLQIIPDEDPENPGHRYGLTYLDWFAPLFDFLENVMELLATFSGLTCPTSDNPVDYATGIEVVNEVDLAIECARGGIVLRRTYRSLSTNDGPFGIGSNHNYGYRLDTAGPQNAEVVNLVLPNGAKVPMSKPTVSAARQNSASATFVNFTNADFMNNQLTTRNNGESTYRWADGRVFHFIPDTRLGISHLVAISDPRGNKVTLHRNPNQLFEILQIEDGVGRLVNLQYDTRSRIAKVTDPVGREIIYTYHDSGTLASVTNLEGKTSRFEYDDQNRLLRKFDANDVRVMENEYDANGRVVKQSLADGGVITFEYILMNPGIGTSPVRETIATDALGQVTRYRFNPQKYLISATDSLGQTTVFERASGNNLLLSVKGNALCRSCGNPAVGDRFFTYNENGNLVSTSDALGNTMQFTYESKFNKLASATDPLGQQSFFQYDAAGNVVKVTDALGNETQFNYDFFGLLTEVIDPAGEKVTIDYDSFANPVKITDPLGHQVKTRYDAVSRANASVDALGNRTRQTLNQLGQVTESTDADSNKTLFEYDDLGQLLSLTDARGNKTQFSYAEMGRVVSRTDPLGQADLREYDLNNNLIRYTDRKGQVSSFEYDELNRLVLESYDDGHTVTRSYDARSRLIAVVDSVGGSYSYHYDEVGRLLESVGPNGTVKYQYDALGRIIQRQVLGQVAVDYSYDAVGNLTAVTSPQGAENYQYDNRNQRTGVTRANGVNTNYIYDAAGQLLAITHKKGEQVLASQNYTLDANGQRISNKLDSAQAQITQASNSEIDLISNQLKTQGEVSYSYDLNGNRLTETGPDGTVNYHWDARNRLVAIDKPDGQRHDFVYDFAGNMTRHDLTQSGVTTSKHYVLDVFTNVVFQSGSDGEQFSILTGLGMDQHLALIRENGAVNYALRDGLNSSIVSADENGEIAARFYYEAFGQTTVDGETLPFQFTGRVPITDGLYYYRARFYDAKVGKFISLDPIGFGGGDVNLYGYVGNSVTQYIDPLGYKGESYSTPIAPNTFYSTLEELVAETGLPLSDLSNYKAELQLSFLGQRRDVFERELFSIPLFLLKAGTAGLKKILDKNNSSFILSKLENILPNLRLSCIELHTTSIESYSESFLMKDRDTGYVVYIEKSRKIIEKTKKLGVVREWRININ